jgi:hypothetical protein
VAITATGKSSAATSGKVVATVKAADVSLRTAKPAANRSTSEAAAAHATAVEATTPHTAAVEATTSSAVHPTTTVTATTASHCWRSKRESESECCRSNQFEISHRILSFPGETEFSPSLGEVLTNLHRSEGCVTLPCARTCTASGAMHWHLSLWAASKK